jgi:hypothetical protein
MSWILEYVRVVTRAVFYDLSGRMATRSEAEKLKSKGITCRGTHNLLAWRRSVLGLAIIGMVRKRRSAATTVKINARFLQQA